VAAALSHGERLRRKIELARGGMLRALEGFWSQPDVAARYPELLFHIHCVVRATVPAMEAARRKAEERSASDPVARAVAAYLARHIPEELHHDDWLLDDLEALGVPRETVWRRVPPPTAAALVGTLYYWVLHAHPVAWMGYAAVTEGHPPSAGFLRSVMERTGLPPEGFRTYLKHAQLDPHHSREMYAALDDMPLTGEQAALLGVVSLVTLHDVAALFERLTGSLLPVPPTQCATL
jgi:Iron-containing redox enzyme